MINPQSYPEQSPEWVASKFFEAWEKRNWKRMMGYCQLSWKKLNEHCDLEKVLQARFRHKLLDVKILEVIEVSEVTKDVKVDIQYKDINVKKRIRRKVRLICEKAPLHPSKDGTWGVNPTSMIRARR